MRPQPLAALRAPLPFLLGLSIIRGESVPVVDLGALLGRRDEVATFGRFVTLDVDGRSVALAVDAVQEVRAFVGDALAALPPLFTRAADDLVQGLSILDGQLYTVLDACKLTQDVPRPEQTTSP